MRVAFISVSGGLGGSEAVLLQILQHLRGTRPAWDLHLVVMRSGRLAERAAALGVATHSVGLPPAIAQLGEWARPVGGMRLPAVAAAAATLPGYQRRFTDALSSIAPDVIHSNGFKAHLLAARARIEAARVWHVHEYVTTRVWSRRLLRRYASRCDACVANSSSVGADLEKALGESLSSPVRIIPNGVDHRRFTPKGPAADLDAMSGLPAAPAGTIRVGLVGTFSRWKGHEVFLRAVARLPAELPVRGYIVGGAIYETAGSQYSIGELRAKAHAYGCANRVEFTGFQEDMPAVMRALDVVVHASTEPEPFGLVLVEAMASARPVISSARGGAAEIVEPEVTALVHRPGDPASLAAAIERLARDPALRSRLGEAGERASARFDSACVGDAFLALYEHVAGAVR